MVKYITPELQENEVLYRGRRYWAFRVSDAARFQSWQDHYSIVVYDRFFGTVVACVDDALEGSVVCGTMQQSYAVKARDIKDLIEETKKGLRELMRL